MSAMFRQLALLILLAQGLFAQTLIPPIAETNPENVIAKMRADLTTYSLDKFFMSRQIGGSSWSPDGKKVVLGSNMSGRHNLWIVPSDGGWPQQLTVSEQRQQRPAWSPDGHWIAFQSDYDGNEQWDLFMVSPQNGDVVQLTRTPEVSESEPTWSPDGRRLAFLLKPQTSPTNEVAIFNTMSRKVVPLTRETPKDLSNYHPLWSPDGKFIAYTQANAKGDDSNVFLVEIATGNSSCLTLHEGQKTSAPLPSRPTAASCSSPPTRSMASPTSRFSISNHANSIGSPARNGKSPPVTFPPTERLLPGPPIPTASWTFTSSPSPLAKPNACPSRKV